MAHIPDGVLSLPVLVGGAVLAAGGLALGLRRLEDAEIPKTAILAAMFFVASLIAVPVGPSSVHLLLAGPMGLVLGVRAVPAVFVGLLLQAVLFGFGGLTSLGVDVVDIAFPGVILALAAGPALRRATPARAVLIAAGVGGVAVLGTAGCVALALALSSADYLPSARIVAVTYLPLAVVEAVISGFMTSFLIRVRPDLISALRRERSAP